MKLGIGSKVWVYDGDRRVYSKPDPGQLWAGSKLVVRACWVEHEIVEETRVSWGIGYLSTVGARTLWKVKKAILAQDPSLPDNVERRGYALSLEEVDGRVWIDTNRVWLAEHISRRVSDPVILKQIAALAGYEDQPEARTGSLTAAS